MGNMLLAASSAAAKSSSSSLNILLIIVVLFGVLYFVMIRPQRNRQRKAQDQRNTVVPGARVRTTAGMYATVVDVDGDDVILEVAPGVEVRFVKRAIMQVLPDEEPVAEPDYSAADDEGPAHADAPPADHEAADDEAADHDAADDEAADDEGADDEASDHDGDESPGHAGDDEPPHAGDESPNGSRTATADDRRAPGSV